MKICLVLLALVAVAAAQHGFGDLIHHEVQALLQADPALTVDMCTTKCDALFDLVDANDETLTDDMCKRTCDCEINQNCQHHHHTQDPNNTPDPSHTHPPHPSHPPHPTHPPHGHHP